MMKRAMTYSVLVLALALAGGTTAADGTPYASEDLAAAAGTHSYIVIMKLEPAVGYTGDVKGYGATKPRPGKKLDLTSPDVHAYRALLRTRHAASLAAAGVDVHQKVHDYTVALNGYSAILTDQQAGAIERQSEVVLVMKDELRWPLTDSSPSFLGLTAEHGPWDKGYTGEGVVIGAIDTGVWPEHPSFADDGSYPPPPVVLDDSVRSACDFGNTAHNPNDAPFECNNKLVGARQMMDTYRVLYGADPDEYDSARDDNGHGTHATSTAAGNAGVEASVSGVPRGTLSGIAPRAHVIAYKALGKVGGYISDIAAAIDQAVADGVDVISNGYGGGASLTGADDLAFLFAADAGVFAATGAGNSGPNPGTVGGLAASPWITAVGAGTQARFWQGTATLGDGAAYAGASITPGVAEAPLVDAQYAGGDLCIPGTLDPSVVSGAIVLCLRGAIARQDKSRAVYMAGGVGTILYNFSDEENLIADTHWTPTVHIDNTPGVAIKAYIASDPDPTAMIDSSVSVWPYAPSMASYSSRGPNRAAPDIIKPDIIAPGVQILAGWSPTPYDDNEPPGELFASKNGTSISTQTIAGVATLLMQAHPDWSPAVIRSAMMTTAYQGVVDNDRMTPADPFDMGAGLINPGGEWTKGSIVEPGLAYDAGFLDYLGFLCDAAPEAFSDPAGTCAFLASIGIPTEARELNLPSIGISDVAGTATVHRTVTSVARENGWRTYDVSVDPPPGFDVTVEPSSIRLKKGQTATYSVTVTNVSSPIGEWHFGSLTWTDRTGHYRVRSPIAVRGSLLDFPAEIGGSGESGSASFDIQFGYTGSYTAAPHGLVSATVTSDNVVQDPDQSFNPADGYSNAHTFAVAGAAHFRVALPLAGTEPGADLDLYVYDPTGAFAALSAEVGMDEQVDITLPMDGTWTVWVHGWLTPGGDSDYDMWTWAVPLASGGSLSVDSAPAAATNGAVETVSVSWSGLSSGTASDWYLGAVSHTGDVGLMGLTLVGIDNR